MNYNHKWLINRLTDESNCEMLWKKKEKEKSNEKQKKIVCEHIKYKVSLLTHNI